MHPNQRLNRSKLSLSPLRTLLTTPNLKNFSSPVAVLPPIYSLSAPSASRNPSLLLSLPRLRARPLCGIGMPPWWCDRGEWIGSWPITPDREGAGLFVGWAVVDVEMVRGFVLATTPWVVCLC